MQKNFLAVIILFAPLTYLAKSEDECALKIRMSDDMENLVNFGKEVGKLFRGESVDGENIVMGIVSYHKTLLTVSKSIPKIGEFIEPLADLYNMFAPTTPSQELKCMAQEFQKIDQHLVAIDQNIQHLNKKIDDVIELIQDKSNQGIAQQLFNLYNQNKDGIDKLASVHRRLIKYRNITTMLDSCTKIDPYYRLEWIQKFLTKNRLGERFLPTLVAASNCKDQDNFYQTTAAMVAEDIKEIVYFDRFCEGIQNRSNSTERDVQKMVDNIRKAFLTFEKHLDEKCIKKNIDWLATPNVLNKDPTQETVDHIYNVLKKKFGSRWFFGVFATMSRDGLFHSDLEEIYNYSNLKIYDQTRAKLIKNQERGKTDILIVWKHESEATNFWKTIDSKFPSPTDSSYTDLDNGEKIICHNNSTKIRERIQAIAGAKNLISTAVGVCAIAFSKAVVFRNACTKFPHMGAFSRTDLQVARQIIFPLCYRTDVYSYGPQGMTVEGSFGNMITITIGYF